MSISSGRNMWIFDRLVDDNGISEFVGDNEDLKVPNVYEDIAPKGLIEYFDKNDLPVRYCVFQEIPAKGYTQGTGAENIFHTARYLVKLIFDGQSYDVADDAFEGIKTALHRTQLTDNQSIVASSRIIDDIKYVEMDGERRFNHLGYVVEVMSNAKE